jgi:hypothetical protein
MPSTGVAETTDQDAYDAAEVLWARIQAEAEKTIETVDRAYPAL